jgi:biopolymer transport protein TolR
MAGAVGSKKGPMADINVTPLIDVVLVLLVVFMVITPMLQSGQSVDLPIATQAISENDVGQYIVVSVTQDRGWWVDAKQICGKDKAVECTKEADSESLIATLNEEFAKDGQRKDGKPPRSILIKADGRLDYGKVRLVMDSIAEKGMTTQLVAAEKGGE